MSVREEAASLRRKIDSLLMHLAREHAELKSLQGSCDHSNRQFVSQENNYHPEFWNVLLQCSDCGVDIKLPNRLPVCEICLGNLTKTDSTDTEAKAERRKPKYQKHMNPPIAFRCTICKKIHILWLEGD